MKVMDPLNIAKICHEANRSYCETLGDFSQPSWAEAPAWQRESALNGVRLHLSGDFPPSASHESWLKEKVLAGWIYGETKNPSKKEHPCMVPYDQLPIDQKRKDHLFKAIVEAFK